MKTIFRNIGLGIPAIAIIVQFIALMVLLATSAFAQERKPINTKVFWFAGSAIIVGSVLTMPRHEIKSTPLLGVGVIAVGFTIDLRNIRIQKRPKMLRNTAKQHLFKHDNL